MSDACVYCGQDVGVTGFAMADGYVCRDCLKSLGLFHDTKEDEERVLHQLGKLEFANYVMARQEERSAEQALANRFSALQAFGRRATLDPTHRIVKFTEPGPKGSTTYFSYNQLVTYELLEDGAQVSVGGVSRAVAGGLLFGAAGAVVGATTAKRASVCQSLLIRLTLTHTLLPNRSLVFVSSDLNKDGSLYRDALSDAQAVMSALDLVSHTNEEALRESMHLPFADTPSLDPYDQLRKLKSLLDDGIVTQGEFEQKKHQLLGI